MAIDPSKGFDFDFSKGLPYNEIKLEGDAHWIGRTIRFTKTDDQDNPQQWSMGRAIYIPPVAFGGNFETEVQFKVTRPMENTHCADGLAFFIVPEGYKFPAAVGIFGRPGVFAVAFDIYPPNPDGHIKLGLCFSERTPKSFIRVPASFLGIDLITLQVTYNSATNLISACVSNGNNETYSVSLTYDLSDILPAKVEVGLASSTGEYVALHDAYSWSFGPLLL